MSSLHSARFRYATGFLFICIRPSEQTPEMNENFNRITKKQGFSTAMGGVLLMKAENAAVGRSALAVHRSCLKSQLGA